jgi:hypothetical protein
MNKQHLEKIWSEVEKYYFDERINGERALQAILYKSIESILPPNYLTLVEPYWFGTEYKPDLVIIDKNKSRLAAVCEIKCSPHWWHSVNSPGIKKDLNKLLEFSNLEKFKPIEYDIFGPDRIFNSKDKIWENGRRTFSIDEESLFIFFDIARKESSVLKKSCINHPIIGNKNFILASGATDPDQKTAEFRIE